MQILRRPPMQTTPVNMALGLIGLCDICTMASYTIYIIRFGYFDDGQYGYSYAWLVYLLGHVLISVALHTVTLYLTVATASLRLAILCLKIQKPIRDRTLK